MDIDFSNIFKRLHVPSRKESGGVGRDWKFIVTAFLVLNSLAILGSLYLFWISNSAGDGSQERIKKTTEVFKQKNLDELIESFRTREETFTRLQTEQPASPDPSL